MFIINQHETNANQIIYFKSQSDSQRYWDFLLKIRMLYRINM